MRAVSVVCVCAAAIYELYTQSTYRIRRSRTMPRRTLDKMSAIVSDVARSSPRVRPKSADLHSPERSAAACARASFNKCSPGSGTDNNFVYIGVSDYLCDGVFNVAPSAHIKRL